MGAQAGVLKDLRRRIHKLAADISALERSYDKDPSPATLSAIRDLVTEHNGTVDQEMVHRSRRSKARYYGEGGRPSRSLAQKLAAPRTQEYITEMLDEAGETHYTTSEISGTILDFYTRLYDNRAVAQPKDIHSYLDDVALGWLAPGHREYLIQPFDVEDVKLAIMSLPTGKAAGLDGLPSEFYKTFVDDLAPRLLEVYAEAYDTGCLPPSLKEALLCYAIKA